MAFFFFFEVTSMALSRRTETETETETVDPVDPPAAGHIAFYLGARASRPCLVTKIKIPKKISGTCMEI